MRTLNRIKSDRIQNKRATDPLDILIFEKGLRATDIIPDKKLGVLITILNNGKVLQIALNDYKKLKKASQGQLNKWEFIGNGIGIHWEELDEDLSIKGMIKDSAINAILGQLKDKGIVVKDAVVKKTAKGAYLVQGHDGKGNRLTTLLDAEKALYDMQPVLSGKTNKAV